MKLSILLWIAVCACAQPKINTVVSSADFRSEAAVEGLATLFGSGLATSVKQASSAPWPTMLGDTELFMCQVPFTTVDKCNAAGLLYVSPTQINFQVPPIPLGYSTMGNLVVRVAGALNLPNQFYGVYADVPHPAIFFMGYDCLTDPRFQMNADPVCGLTMQQSSTFRQSSRGAVTDVRGTLLTSAYPAKLGDYYTIWLTGVDVHSSVKFLITDVPLYGGPGWYIDGNPTFAGMSKQFPGLYQINFQLPISIATGSWGYPAWPCGTYHWELSIDIGQGYSEAPLMQIPVLVKPGDVPCN